MKNLFKISSVLVLTSVITLASGWRIPEQSSKSVALSGAYVANANGADSTYYNPANMSFNKNKLQSELSIMAISLSSIDYEDNRLGAYDSKSQTETEYIPTLFLSSKDYDGLRYGFSITAPGGLAKRWESPFAKTFAQEFSLRIIEFNPTLAYKLTNNLSIGGGLRAVYSDGIVKSDGTILVDADRDGTDETPVVIKRDMEGNTIEYGYNIALAYKPNELSNISATYRSNIDIKEQGDAKLYYNGVLSNDSSASVTVPLPAVLSLAFSYKFNKATIEFEYDKTYWSEYENLDFNYGETIANPVLAGAFDDPKDKNWKDTSAYRIGLSYQYNNSLKLMAGYAIDEAPTPSDTLGFELPDSDAKIYSLGFDYKLDPNSSIGFGYLYDKKESRSATNESGVDGTFDGASAQIISFAYRTTF